MADTIYDDLTKYTYESLHTEALNAVSDDVDKREGSVVFDMTAPAAKIIAQCFDVLYQVAMQSRVQTATGEYLDMCASQTKIYRNQATPAKWRIAIEPTLVSLVVRSGSQQGTRFISTNGLNYQYEVIKNEGDGNYIVECLTAGSDGGRDFGELEELPITHKLKRVSFVKCVDGGSDTESDADFRMRWWSTLRTTGYGGNFDDYKRWILEEFAKDGGYNFDGFFLFPAYNGGGTVLIVPTIAINGEKWQCPDESAIAALKDWIDPEPTTGLGAGKAPVGHCITVAAPTNRFYTASLNIKLDGDVTLTDALKTKIEKAICDYFAQQRGTLVTTKNSSYPNSYELTISFSALESAIHAQSANIRSITNLEIATEINRIKHRYTSDFTIVCTASSVILPQIRAITISEA